MNETEQRLIITFLFMLAMVWSIDTIQHSKEPKSQYKAGLDKGAYMGIIGCLIATVLSSIVF